MAALARIPVSLAAGPVRGPENPSTIGSPAGITIGVSGDRDTASGGSKTSASLSKFTTTMRTSAVISNVVTTKLLRRMRRRRRQTRGIGLPSALRAIRGGPRRRREHRSPVLESPLRPRRALTGRRKGRNDP